MDRVLLIGPSGRLVYDDPEAVYLNWRREWIAAERDLNPLWKERSPCDNPRCEQPPEVRQQWAPVPQEGAAFLCWVCDRDIHIADWIKAGYQYEAGTRQPQDGIARLRKDGQKQQGPCLECRQKHTFQILEEWASDYRNTAKDWFEKNPNRTPATAIDFLPSYGDRHQRRIVNAFKAHGVPVPPTRQWAMAEPS